MRIFGDLAIVFYATHATATKSNGELVEGHGRITHTWKRTEKGWKIIAGMGAEMPEEEKG